MHRAYLLVVTAVVEGGIGILMLVSPSVLIALLLGVEQSSPEANVCGRIAGAALLAIGIACWLGRSDRQSFAQQVLLTGALTYNVAAAAILASTGLFSSLVGFALWPAVVLHLVLAGWCVVCLWNRPPGK
jgi:hypothetical protein